MKAHFAVRHLRPGIIILCVVALAVGALLLRDYLIRKRAFAERTACVGSLIRLRLTKPVYVEKHGLTNGVVIPNEVFWSETGVVERRH